MYGETMLFRCTHSQKKLILFSAIPAILLLCGLFTAGEIWLRYKYEKIERITGVKGWELAVLGDLSYYWDQYHPVMGWVNRPSYQSDNRVPFRVTINSQGLRANRDYSPEPKKGVKRYAVIGDSCVFGEEVDDDKTLPYFLERQIANTEFLNFGVHGYGLGEMALLLEEKVFQYNPEHIILVLTLPVSFGRTTTSQFVHSKPLFAVENGQLALHNVPVPESTRQPWMLKHSFVAAWFFGRPKALPESDSFEEAIDVSRALMERIIRQCRKKSIAISVVALPAPEWIKSMYSDERVGSLMGTSMNLVNSIGCDVFDMTVFLRQILNKHGKALESPTGTHWSGKGNELIAENITLHLKQKSSGK